LQIGSKISYLRIRFDFPALKIKNKENKLQIVVSLTNLQDIVRAHNKNPIEY